MDPALFIQFVAIGLLAAIGVPLAFRKNTEAQNESYRRQVRDDVAAAVLKHPGVTPFRLQATVGRNSAAVRDAIVRELAQSEPRIRLEQRGRIKRLFPIESDTLEGRILRQLAAAGDFDQECLRLERQLAHSPLVHWEIRDTGGAVEVLVPATGSEKHLFECYLQHVAECNNGWHLSRERRGPETWLTTRR